MFQPQATPENATDNFELPVAIRVFGARTHNLRGVDVEIPLGSLTVITGVSGSGKSSLAFNTIFAEGRYRYLSSVSAKSRELLQGVDRPDVDLIDGLPPVLCVEQREKGAKKRSTVATTSEIYDYLRLLFARLGKLHCPTCRIPVTSQSRAAIVEHVLQSQDRQKILVLAPIVRARAGSHSEVFARIVKDGYVRARVDGELVDAADPPKLEKSTPHDIEIVIDRLILKDGIQSRLEESVDLALEIGQGQCVISQEVDGLWRDRLFSTRFACSNCGTNFPSLEPRSFSFNSAAGACANCQGLGVVEDADETERTCEVCEGTRLGPIPRSVLIDGISITDFCENTTTDATAIVDRWTESLKSSLITDVSEEYQATRNAVLQHILPEIAMRLKFLNDVGLQYLTLDRSCDTLSSGEFQRTRLAACLGSQLSGVCYILDEPTAGLHSRDTERLIETLVRLRDEGNTVLLIEHDLNLIRKADYVIDLGPGAGRLGGQVLATGTPLELVKNPSSITGQFLSRARPLTRFELPLGSVIDAPVGRLNKGTQGDGSGQCCALTLVGATLHNLHDVSIEVPLQKIVCVTGVSGSGKSSLVIHTLVPALRRALGERLPAGGPFRALTGFESLSKVVRVDQSPLGRSARSSPATYTGIWDEIRSIFSKTKESKLRGFNAKSFSLSVPDARCSRCAGKGMLPVDERRFSDWNVRCPDCDGRRFAPALLSIRYRGKSVVDVLEMNIAEAAIFFENHPRLSRILNLFNELGLGYLKLGQPASTLSGGEAQRIKLGTELAKSNELNGACLFVLDEPTSGLHPADVQQLVRVLRRLVESGNSVLVIEHNDELISASDWIIEIGPGAGSAGGQLVSAGPAS